MKFILYSQDKQGALSIRKDNRDAHLKFLGGTASGVTVLSAGPWLDDTGEMMSGSVIIVEADTLDTVKAWNAQDPYTKAGLPQAVNIHPFIWAIGAPA